MKFNYASLISLALLAGCTSAPVKLTEAKSVPANRLYWTDKPKTTNPAKVIIVRDTSVMGLAIYHKTTIDDKPLAELDQAEKVEVELDAGDYVFGVYIPLYERFIDQTLVAGKTYTYRISSDESSPPRIVRSKTLD